MITPKSGRSVSQEQLEMQRLLSDPRGFERYASEKMPDFIQVVRDYRGFVRDLMPTPTVDPTELTRLNEEVFVTYNVDIDSVAFVSAQMGEAPTQFIKAKTIKVPFIELKTPRLTITQLELDTQPFELMERAQQRSGQAMSRLEDELWLTTADAIVDAYPTQVLTSANASIEKADLVAIKQKFSRNDVPFGGYLMNPVVYDDFLLWGENDLDPVTQRTVLETGDIPTIWNGVRMVSGISVPEKYVYGVANKEVLGRMPILRDVTIKINEIPETNDREIFAFEYVGLFIHSHLAVVRLEFTSRP